MVAKKFKRKWANRNAFIFEDSKNASEFYNYINTKYELNHQDVEFKVPFEINNKVFCFSFSEVEIREKTFNLLPGAANAALHNKTQTLCFKIIMFLELSNWYILIGVNEEPLSDALKEEYIDREVVINYLKAM